MTTSDTQAVHGEVRMLIDGKLVEAGSGKVFDNINPATEEVLGQVADGGHEDMDTAIAAARRAFDETNWSTDGALRKRCLLQLQAALEEERELLRAELVAEVGTPVLLTYGPQLDAPLTEGLTWPAHFIDEFAWERELPEGTRLRHSELAPGHQGGRGGGRCDRAMELPLRGVHQQNRPGFGHRQHGDPQGRAQYALERHPAGPSGGRAHRLPARGVPSGHHVGQRSGRGPRHRSPGGPHLVHRVDRGGAPDHGEGSPHLEAPLPRTGRQVGGHRPRRRRLRGQALHGLDRLHPRRPGLRDAHADAAAAGALRRGHRHHGGRVPQRPLRGPDQPRQPPGAPDQRPPAGPVLAHIERGSEEGARVVVGGGRPAHLDKGYYVEPTLFADVENSMSIAQQEIFGPVLVVVPFDDDDDAVRVANDSEYGLGVGVTSASEERALAVARRIRAGTVGVNGGIWYGADAPFGGYKASGIGRQNGIEGFEQYTETKTIAGGLPPKAG